MLENDVDGQGKFKSRFIITNNSKETLEGHHWAIYYNFNRKLKNELVTGKVAISHVNGDLFKITPTALFKLKSGDSVVIDYMSSYWAINTNDAPTGLYIVFNDQITGKETKPVSITNYTVKPFLKPEQYKRYKADVFPQTTALSTFNKNKIISKLDKDKLLPVIPVPVDYSVGNKTMSLDPTYSINASNDLKNEKEQLINLLNSVFVEPINSKSKDKTIILQLGEFIHQGKTLKKGDEGYKLEIKNFKITITGTDEAGVFYGIQTLKALFPVETFKAKVKSINLTEVNIIDYPRFPYRGMMLDVARNFQKKDNILKYLDLLAYYKINKFHFHLTDDEGWRVPIKALPELTEVGGKRGHKATGNEMIPSFSSGPSNDPTLSPGAGYYTREEFVEILKYATDRHIQVIPEIDVPGHSRAAIKSMDARFERLMKEGKSGEATKYLLRDLNDKSEYASVQMWNDNVICICQPSALNFIEEVTKELVAMYKEANAPITSVHIGGDEVPKGVWTNSVVCKQLLDADPELSTTEELPMYFLKKVNEILGKYNLRTAGWEEIALKKVDNRHEANPIFVSANFTPYIWNNLFGRGKEEYAYKIANSGYKVVLSNVTHLYFDLAYNNDPEELGDYWGGYIDTRRPYEFIPFDIYKCAYDDPNGKLINQGLCQGKVMLNDTGKANILGIQGQLWSENVTNKGIMEFLSFPRIISLAERAWAKDPSWSMIGEENTRNEAIDKDWNVFANTIGQKEFVRLDNTFGGVAYRVSLPGAFIENGLLNANVEFPGLTIRYTTDGTEPSMTSTMYTMPVAVKGTIKLKAFTSTGRSSRTVVLN